MARQAKASIWHVPPYTILHQQTKQHAYCLVIPVRNEVANLDQVLHRLAQNQLTKLVDIVIIDGGSTDGTLTAIRSHFPMLTAILQLDGQPLGLSSQLRSAYSFALMQGYQGIVTMDGNNKDNPAAIPSFLAALEQGAHMVQGSRFVPGGKAIGTPWWRYLAIRLLHAPLLAWASRFPWTDTTQGFRAYQTSILLDKQVAPFRACFERYELLAYLSYRLPRLGYRCIELPTERRYPKGKIPTKIQGWQSHLQLLWTLVRVCSGALNPAGPADNAAKAAKQGSVTQDRHKSPHANQVNF